MKEKRMDEDIEIYLASDEPQERDNKPIAEEPMIETANSKTSTPQAVRMGEILQFREKNKKRFKMSDGTEEEVFYALENFGLEKEKEEVKWWYDGFVFGKYKDIYNPWSILNFLDTGIYGTYWANTSSNSLVSKLIKIF